MDNLDTLQLVISYNLENIGKVSSTCREWHIIIGKSLDQEKMKYLRESSLRNYDYLISNLNFEMYRCGTAYYDDDEFYDSWREYIDDWEDEWYSYRYYSFFYKPSVHVEHVHPHLWHLT